jgi:hypothetical protein
VSKVSEHTRVTRETFRQTPRRNHQGWSLVGHQSTFGGCERAFTLAREEGETLELLSSWLLHGAPRRFYLWSSPPRLLAFFLKLALDDRNHPGLFDLHRTGEVRHGYRGTDEEATKIQEAIFLKLKARVTSVVARSAASRMLGYTCGLEIKHNHRTLPSTPALKCLKCRTL